MDQDKNIEPIERPMCNNDHKDNGDKNEEDGDLHPHNK